MTTMTATIYHFSVTDRRADHFLAACQDAAKGTLEDAIELAKSYDCRVSMTKEEGAGLVGWVYGDGSYTLK